MDELDNGIATRLDQQQARQLITRRSLLRAVGAAAATAVTFGNEAQAQSEDSKDATPPSQQPAVAERRDNAPTIEQKAWDLGFDLGQMFRFVADEVQYDAYAGVLRGAKGTLWGLAGNSVDQALLLAALLDQALIPTRFVAGNLDGEAGQALLDTMRPNPETIRSQATKVLGDVAPAFEARQDLTEEQRTALVAASEYGQRAIDEARRQVDDLTQTIQDALAGAGVILDVPTLELPMSERTSHVWLQYADGPNWIDLDPTIRGTEPGEAFAAVAQTWDELPDDLYQRVGFRAIVERSVGGQLVSEDSLVSELRAADLVGSPIYFTHIDPAVLREVGASIGGIVEGTLQYTPTLLWGSGGNAGTPITVPTDGGALSTLGSSDRDGEPIAEWLEIQITVPDAEPSGVTREVFDRIGIDRRASGTFDLETLEPLALTDVPDRGTRFLPLEATWIIASASQPTPGGYFDQDFSIPDLNADVAMGVFGCHMVRDQLAMAVGLDRGYRWFANEPNLTALITEPVLDSTGAVVVNLGLDLLNEAQGTAQVEGSAPSVHPRLLAGVLAHAAERLITESELGLEPGPQTSVASVGRIFDEATRTGIAITAMTPASGLPAGFDASDAAKARMSEALGGGSVIVVPERAVVIDGHPQIGWWEVDPNTGRTVDVSEDGRGFGPLGEYIVTLLKTSTMVQWYFVILAAVILDILIAVFVILMLVIGRMLR